MGPMSPLRPLTSKSCFRMHKLQQCINTELRVCVVAVEKKKNAPQISLWGMWINKSQKKSLKMRTSPIVNACPLGAIFTEIFSVSVKRFVYFLKLL